MMRKFIASVTVLALLLGLCACTVAQPEDQGTGVLQGSTWQEQYDLGVRYLSEGNYQEAILAFTAAIEIDPKRAPAYVGRGDVYILSGETEENLAAAKADYEKAIELDGTNAEAYLGLANVYTRQGDYEKALEILQQGLDAVGQRQDILDAIAALNIDAKGIYGQTEFTHRYNYCDFDDMSTEQKAAVELIANAAIHQDEAELFNIYDNDAVKQNWDSLWNICTIWNEFKIMFSPLAIEMRPENGIGYYACIQPSHVLAYGDYQIILSSCPCEDWQWNGWVVKKGFDVSADAVITLGDEESGTMKSSLREGVFMYNDYHSKVSYEYLFQDGALIECNGVKNEYPTVGGTGNISYSGTKDQWIDALYW